MTVSFEPDTPASFPQRKDAPLTEEQQAFAEANHGLLLSFMTSYDLDADLYDRLALRYLRTVVRYLTEPKLRDYAFSTIVWYHLRSELSNILRTNYLQLEESLPDPDTQWENGFEEDTIDQALWTEIERKLTYKQVEAVLLRNQGYSNREIAELCHVKPKAIEKRFSRIRRKLKKGFG
jgi:RNA polymerase sigma factor (sigma-70 family)